MSKLKSFTLVIVAGLLALPAQAARKSKRKVVRFFESAFGLIDD